MIATIAEVVAQEHESPEALVAALVEREEYIKQVLTLAGAQFGLRPFIVAEVLAEVGLGNALSEEERAYVHQTYIHGMEQLQAEYEQYRRDHPEQ